MRKELFYITVIVTAGCLLASCVKSFNPAVTTVNANILVVEGFINTGGDTTKITLSHTVTIGSKNSSVPETGATVTVEDAAGTSYPLPETSTKGSYASKGALALINGKQYHVRIKTAGGKTYLSDLEIAKAAPPIDSVGYINQPNQMLIYLNSHDATNSSVYYKYTISEAWIFRAKYDSQFISNGVDGVTVRTAAQDIWTCYGSDSSTNITINSTAAQAKDVVYQFPITTLSDTSEKFKLRYSILVSQQAITKDAYTFWQNLKTNTENLGSIFDAQPSTISGNIHNIANAAEPVIGFIGAGSVQRKRIYINKTDLPANYVAGYPYTCYDNPTTAYYLKNPLPPGFKQPDGTIWGYPAIIHLPSASRIINEITYQLAYTYNTAECSDCTIRGMHNPPPFWKP